MFTSSSNLVILSSSHLHIFTSSHLHIFTSSHLLIFTSAMFLTSFHLHIFTSSHLQIFSHIFIFTSSHLLIFTSSHLLSLPFFLSLSLSLSLVSLSLSLFVSLLPSCPLSRSLSFFFFSLFRPWAVPTRHHNMATFSHEMRFECQKLMVFCEFGWPGSNPFGTKRGSSQVSKTDGKSVCV